MAQSELTQNEYNELKSDLGQLSNNQAAHKHHVGKRKVAMVRRSKSYAGYLQIRRNEARKAAESRPAKAVPGVSELPQENQEFLVQTDDGQSLPADQTKTDTTGTYDVRSDEEKAADAARRKDAEARRNAEIANRKYARKQRYYAAFTYGVIAFAIIGIVVTAGWLLSLVF